MNIKSETVRSCRPWVWFLVSNILFIKQHIFLVLVIAVLYLVFTRLYHSGSYILQAPVHCLPLSENILQPTSSYQSMHLEILDWNAGLTFNFQLCKILQRYFRQKLHSIHTQETLLETLKSAGVDLAGDGKFDSQGDNQNYKNIKDVD